MKGCKIENVGGKLAVVEESSGRKLGEFLYRHAAEDFIRRLPDPPAPEVKPQRARTKKGTLKADDPSTPEVNEAWEGGKAPKKKAVKRKAAPKKAAKKKK